MVNPHKPLRLRMPDMRKVALIGVAPNGNIVVAVSRNPEKDDWQTTPYTFQADGRMPGGDAFTPVLVNDIEITSGFYPLDERGEPFGRGMTFLSFVWTEYSSAAYAIEVIRHDGVPKEATIHARPKS